MRTIDPDPLGGDLGSIIYSVVQVVVETPTFDHIKNSIGT